MYLTVSACICQYDTVFTHLEAYHMSSLPLEWHGMNCLLTLPIAVIESDQGKELQGASHIRHVHKPFQHRMELARH